MALGVLDFSKALSCLWLTSIHSWGRKGSLAEQGLLTLPWWLSWGRKASLVPDADWLHTACWGSVVASQLSWEVTWVQFPHIGVQCCCLPVPALPPRKMKWLKGIKSLCGLWKQACVLGSHCFLSFMPYWYLWEFFRCEGPGKSAQSSLLNMCSQSCLISRLRHNVAIKALPLGSPCSVAYFWPEARETDDKLKLVILVFKVPEWGQQSLLLWVWTFCGHPTFHYSVPCASCFFPRHCNILGS